MVNSSLTVALCVQCTVWVGLTSWWLRLKGSFPQCRCSSRMAMRSPMAVRMGRHRTEWTWIPESCPVPSGKRSSCNTQVSEGRYHWGAGELQGAGQWSGHGHWCEWQRRQILTLVPQRGTSFCLWGCKLPGETWWRPFYVGVWNHGKFDDITKRCRYFYFTSSARCWFHDTLYSISTSMWWTVPCLRWVNLLVRRQPHPHDVLYQQCFASLGNMSGNGCPKCDRARGDEAGRTILGSRWSEQT